MNCTKPEYKYIILITVLGCLLSAGCGYSPEPDVQNDRINIAQALSAVDTADCYEKVRGVQRIEFPKDSGPHPGFQTEWWYYTGNLETGPARHFGYQLTFFRQALSCEPVQGTSKWRTQQLYFAHFAITDTRDNHFYSGFRMNRQSLGIAGAQNSPHRVWIDNWQAEQQGHSLTLTARHDNFSIQLSLTPEKPVILQGENGFSQKGNGDFNASYYYSLPRLATRGTIQINENTYPVKGTSWFDHEWSTSALSKDVAGWDWFSVHLDDGRDIMVCRIRNTGGKPNGYGFGSISFSDGSKQILSEADFQITVTDRWKSRKTGKIYPGGWQIHLPGQDLNLNVTPVIPDQEHTHTFAYWEGAARFEGPDTAGYGYIEMTGY